MAEPLPSTPPEFPCSGRSCPASWPNAPLLLYNGSVAYDWAEKMIFSHPIDLNPSEVLPRAYRRNFPDLLLGVQGLEAHYIFRHEPLWQVFGRENGCEVREICFAQLPSPFLKMALYGTIRDGTVSQFYEITPNRTPRFRKRRDGCRNATAPASLSPGARRAF